MTARLLIGDVFDRMAELPDGSVDLVLTSPPFLALRSYLPADHPDKALEIGSEATPAAFIDTLLRLTAEWRRLLAPHGSICVELGDSFSGSGGAGGDYDSAGWRDGQPRWGGSASRGRESQWSYADALWLAGIIDAEGSIIIHKQHQGDNSPSYRADVCISMMDRQVCDRAAEIAGVGNVNQDGRGVYSWHVSAQQARYVLLNIWPHLLIKQRQACAAIELQRHIEETKRRGRWSPVPSDEIEYRETIRQHVCGWNARGEDRGQFVAWWEPPTPKRIRHSLVGGSGWPMDKSLCLIPELYRVGLVYGLNPLTGQASPAVRWRVRNVVRWCRPNPPVGALGDKFRPATTDMVVACLGRDRWFDLDAVRGPGSPNTHARGPRWNDGKRLAPEQVTGSRNDDGQHYYHEGDPAGAPPLDWWDIPTHPYRGAHYATWPPALCDRPILAMCPRHVCTTCGQPRRRIVGETTYNRTDTDHVPPRLAMTDGQRVADGVNQHHQSNGANTSVIAQRDTVGWSDCGHNTWRPGMVLDPFAGSGTTLAAAVAHGRHAAGIDLNPSSADLARERCGMFLEVAS